MVLINLLYSPIVILQHFVIFELINLQQYARGADSLIVILVSNADSAIVTMYFHNLLIKADSRLHMFFAYHSP